MTEVLPIFARSISIASTGSSSLSTLRSIHTRSILIKSKTQTYNLVVKKIDDRTMREFMTNASGTITGTWATWGCRAPV